MTGLKKLRIVLLGSVLAVAIAGCSSKTPEEESYDLLEELASIEQGYEEQHEPLQKLEAEDNEIYAQIIELGMKEMDEIKTLSDEAITGIEEREELMKKEKESINESRERFGDFDGLIEELSDKKAQTEAAELQKIMKQRYDDYDQLYDLYLASLAEEKKLYELFKDEKATKDQFETQIESVNKTYTELSEANAQFNEQTEKYNNKKISFYNLAGIEVDSEQP
ncbi:YkyA family protein [Pradoshia sp.]|uniref:YkyA family protein n=1 Tax=Pradoshia sp. TaxID=2651281 RepID=UPI003F02A146